MLTELPDPEAPCAADMTILPAFPFEALPVDTDKAPVFPKLLVPVVSCALPLIPFLVESAVARMRFPLFDPLL
jgi:hypothetical protein